MSAPRRLAVPAAALLAASFLVAAGPAPKEGAHGPLFPVAERDLLGAIEAAVREKVADGTVEREVAAARERAAAYVGEPPPVAGIVRAERPSTRLFDPSVVIDRPVTDLAGNAVHPAGTRVNPLESVSLDGALVFFDARDPWQVAVAVGLAERGGPTRAVLVAGSPDAFARHSGMRAYFDQHGALTARLGIREVPAVVTQEGLALRIDTRAPAAGKGG